MHAPEENRRMVVVLHDQLGQFAAAMLVGTLAGFEHADKGDFGPDRKAQFITGIVKVLAVLVVGQADGVCAPFLDDLGVLAVVSSGQGVALV